MLGSLVATRGARTHGEIAASVDPDLDRATVYRILIDLTEAGLVRRSDLGDHAWRFEWIGGGAHGEGAHPHFICGSCGTVQCLPESAVSVHVPRGAPRSLRKRRGVSVQLRGLCDACQ